MAKTKQEPVPEVPIVPGEDEGVDQALVPIDESDVLSIFNRAVNQRAPITVNVGKVLTRPLVAMAHRKLLMVRCEGEMYTYNLPTAGRNADGAPARQVNCTEILLVDGKFVLGDEFILVLNEMMVSAMQREGYRVVTFTAGEKKSDTKEITIDGKPLTGAGFAFKSGNVVDGKRYRVVYTATLKL